MDLEVEKNRLSEFLQYADYEGGYMGLIKHSSDTNFPDRLKGFARNLEQAHEELEQAVALYCAALGFQSVNSAYEYYEENYG